MKFNRRIVISGSIGIALIVASAIIVPIVLHYRQITKTDDPIVIWSDADFIMYNFTGEGTEESPFLIENLNINTTAENGIYIRRTTKHFIIRNCVIDAVSNGIHIDKVAAGSATITNNTCINNNQTGIFIERSDGIKISKNICKSNGFQAIFILYSNYTILTENTCVENRRGIEIYKSHHNMINNNDVNLNKWGGIEVYYSTNITAKFNEISFNLVGIFVQSTNSSIMSYNLIHANLMGGIFINRYIVTGESVSSHNIIHHNSFLDNIGIIGSHQAIDNGYNNTWFDEYAMEGNWWSDYSGFGFYPITGSANSHDEYPLSTRPVF